ncbi:MAG: hypothetical protein P4L57_01305 [Rhizomicrobium sp.]|nr:hypothetical protein [Rhizomicrobium sp.]
MSRKYDDDDPPYPKPGTPEWEALLEPNRAYMAEMKEEREVEDAARAAAEKGEKTLTPDDIRSQSAEKLLVQLDAVAKLTARCERVVAVSNPDSIAPLNAAAGLMTASAHVATALAKLTQTENRQRHIIERIQPPASNLAHSNVSLDASPPATPEDLSRQAAAALDGLLFDTLQRKMLLYMNLVAGKTFDADLKKAYPEAYAPGGALGETSAKPSTSA